MLRRFTSHGWQSALVLAVVVRVAVFAFAALSPIPNESGQLVSPLLPQQGIDINYYLQSRDRYFSDGVPDLVARLQQIVDPTLMLHQALVVAPPLLPFLLHVFDYGPSNTLPLALLFLGVSIALVAMWLKWFHGMGVPTPWLMLFAVVPNPLWFTLSISTDLLFAFLFALFYLMYFRETYSTRHIVMALVFVSLAALARSHGIALLIVVIVDLALYRPSVGLRARVLLGIAPFLLLSLLALYYSPHFNSHSAGSVTITYFGIPQSAYLNGLFEVLPQWLDNPASWGALLASKLVYFVGLRPSYGETSIPLVLIRAAVGVVLLPGLLHVIVRGRSTHRLLVALFLLPVLLGAAQDRYNLAILPLLFYHGTLAYRAMWSRVRNIVYPD